METPRVNQWWNAYRSGAISAQDFLEAIRGLERENEKLRHDLTIAEDFGREEAMGSNSP